MEIDIIKNYKEIEEHSEQILYSEDWKGARDLIYFLNENIHNLDLQKSNILLYQKYKKIILKLKWICMDIYSEEEILKLIENSFTNIYGLNKDYNIWHSIKNKLLQELDLDKRNNFKIQIRKALKKNRHTLVSNGSIKSVSDWINEYVKNVGEGMVEKLQQLNFFQKNSNFQSLNKDEKERVKKLLNFYERLKVSSKSLLGLEEGIPVPEEESQNSYIRDGQVITPEKKDKLAALIEKAIKSRKEKIFSEIQQENNNLTDLKQMLSQYPEGSLERKVVEEEIGKLNR